MAAAVPLPVRPMYPPVTQTDVPPASSLSVQLVRLASKFPLATAELTATRLITASLMNTLMTRLVNSMRATSEVENTNGMQRAWLFPAVEARYPSPGRRRMLPSARAM